MNLACSCGSKDFQQLKFGGRMFQVQGYDRINFFKGSGLEPDIWLCKSCHQLLFSLNPNDFDELKH